MRAFVPKVMLALPAAIAAVSPGDVLLLSNGTSHTGPYRIGNGALVAAAPVVVQVL